MTRRNYLDWMRGLAVLIMIEAHVVDAWTRAADRTGVGFRNAIILGGFGAPLFLFLAGVAVVLGAASRQRRLGSAELAAAATRRRGWEIFGLAFLFRLQAYVLSPGATLRGILKVDILNNMGPSIVAAATIWQYAGTRLNRGFAFAAVTIVLGMATPLVRVGGWL
ncbi:MAG: heparan-alpha-glucosaminide N-acetyltransferase domain-containing protein, partial [Vicinamibacterales bacterium]